MKNSKNPLGISSAQRVCLFGLGALLEDCYDQVLMLLGRTPDCLCDNAPEKWGRIFHGLRCLSPKELLELGTKTLVVITVRNHEAIAVQLARMGVTEVFALHYEQAYHRVRAVCRVSDEHEQIRSQTPAAVSLEGKWTLVTGASRGLGRCIALEMAKLGSNIIVHARSSQHLENITSECAGLGSEIVPITAELSDMTEVDAMLSSLERTVPPVDIVFNNAAISPPSPGGFWDTPIDDFLACYRVNTMAPIRICQHLLPLMIRRGFGRMVCMTSSIQKRPGEMAYACSKAALNKFVHDLAPSLKGTGVSLSLADPGWLRTDMGGSKAPLTVETALPGVLLGALLRHDINGCWINAQDYRGLSLPEAMTRAEYFLHRED